MHLTPVCRAIGALWGLQWPVRATASTSVLLQGLVDSGAPIATLRLTVR